MEGKKMKENESYDAYIIAEYNALRDEINHLNGLASSALQVSVLSSLAIIGYFLQLKSLSLILFPIPFFLILPSLFIIFSRFQAVMRISGYIRVFLEKDNGLKHENRYLKFLSNVEKSEKKVTLSLRETIFYLHLGLGLLSIGVFIYKGVLPDIGCWTSIFIYLFAYLSPFPFYFYAYRIVKRDWRDVYGKYWKKIKEDEKGQTRMPAKSP